MKDFETLIQEANQQAFAGWDFSYVKGRMMASRLSWDYKRRVTESIAHVETLLDMGTGGGEFLSSLPNLPKETCATEAYAPNVPVATERLAPLGVKVFHIESDDDLPFEDGQFDIIINRHEAYSPQEVHRILKPGGTFITQQVGGTNEIKLNEYLGAPANPEFAHWDLKFAVEQLYEAEFDITSEQEEFPETQFMDIGAIVYYLNIVEWQITGGFKSADYLEKLSEMDASIRKTGFLSIPSHRFYLEAVKK
jgi:SAM-dependent methyltransferase